MNNPNLPTLRPFTKRTQPTSPDVTFSCPDLSLGSEWDTFSELSSEHLPIIIQIQIGNPIQPKSSHTFLNCKKANCSPLHRRNWNHARDFDITKFRTIDAAAAKLTKAITRASQRQVPARCIRNFTLIFTPEIRSLTRQRKHLRSQLPSIKNHRRLNKLYETIAGKIQEHQDSLWRLCITAQPQINSGG